MPIKFPHLLQDSWNFIRNQRTFSTFAIGCLMLLQIANLLLLSKIPMEKISDAQLALSLLPTLLVAILNIFITTLLILNINDINNGSFNHFFQNTRKALVKLFPVILLNIIMVLPLSVGMSFQAFGSIGGSNLTVIALPLIVSGAFLFIKLCLAVYAYLIEELNSVGDGVRFTWMLSRGRTLPLFLFCVIAYLVPQILTAFVSRLGANVIGTVLTVVVSACLTLFVTVFSFRFYQAYRRQAGVRG